MSGGAGGTVTRLAAAAVGLAGLVPAVVFGGVVAVEIIVPIVAVVCLAEYAAMAFPGDRWGHGAALSAGYALVYGATVYGTGPTVGAAWAATALGAMVFATFSAGDLEGAADRAGRLLVGIGWIGLLATIVLLRRTEHGLAWLFLVLGSSWLGDTGAYFAGRAFGRHPLYPRVSPKKTWEGVAGGITLATVGTFCIRALGLPELSIPEGLLLGPVLCVMGVVGDLAESMLKRSFAVKDSGWILPGHGGMLDRIDSVMFVAPVLYLWVLWMEGG